MKTYEEIRKEITEGNLISKGHKYDWLEYSTLEKLMNCIERDIKSYVEHSPHGYKYCESFTIKQKIDNKDSFLKSIIEELEKAEYINKGCKIEQDKEHEDVYYVEINVLLFPISRTKRFIIKVVDMIYQFFPIFWVLIGIIESTVLCRIGLQFVSKVFFVGWIPLALMASIFFIDSQEAINGIIIRKSRS